MTATKFRRLTGKTETDTDRGRLILESTSLIRNSGAFVIEDVIEDLLRSGSWRAYTFPDGTHHEWLDREFDYFVSAQQFEWDKIKRSITKPEVQTLLADYSGRSEKAAKDRRAIAEIQQQFPHVEFKKLVSDHVRDIASSKNKRSTFEQNGKVMAAVTPDKPWEFRVKRAADSSLDDRAKALIAKMDADLRKRVYQLLDQNDRTRRRSNSGTEPKPVASRARGV